MKKYAVPLVIGAMTAFIGYALMPEGNITLEIASATVFMLQGMFYVWWIYR